MLMDNVIFVSKLNTMATTLKQAIEVNQTSPDDPDKGYAYAAGYSRSAMQNVLDDIQFLLKNFPPK
jgi:hypothetical protein